MNAKNFLKHRFEDIIRQVQTIQVSYEYFEYSDTHIVEVIPQEEFENNELYKDLEGDLYLDFNKEFFPSTLLISTEDSLNKVSNPEWVINGEKLTFPINICLTLEETSIDFNDNIEFPNFSLNYAEIVIQDKVQSNILYAMAA